MFRSLNIIAAWLRRFVGGPIDTIEIDSSGTIAGALALNRRRPIDIIVDNGCVLKRDLIVPTEAKSDLSHATMLLIETETPFETDEVLTSAVYRSHTIDGIHILICILPRRILAPAEAMAGYSKTRVRKIVINGFERTNLSPNFALSLHGKGHWKVHIWRFSLIAVLLAANIFVLQLAGTGRVRSLQAQEVQQQLQSELRKMIDEIAFRESQQALTSTGFPQPMSLVDIFNNVAPNLPKGVEVRRLAGRLSTVTLSIASPDPVDAADQIGSELTNWITSIEGMVQVEADGRSSANIVLRPKSP